MDKQSCINAQKVQIKLHCMLMQQIYADGILSLFLVLWYMHKLLDSLRTISCSNVKLYKYQAHVW